MKLFKLFAATVLSVSLIASATASSLEAAAAGFLKEQLRNNSENLILYQNTDRDQIVAEYVGQAIDMTNVTISNVQASYSKVEGKENTYTIFLFNSSTQYFFDGQISIENNGKFYNVNLYMLPPGGTDSFEIELGLIAQDFSYSFVGTLYTWSNKPVEPDSFDIQHELDQNGARSLVVVDADSITDDDLKSYAEYYYTIATIYNYKLPRVYYFVTKANSDGSDMSNYEYEMYVNTTTQEAIIKDSEGNVLMIEKY